jgi:hypothetical protein
MTELDDRREIVEVSNQYFFALDSRRPELMAPVFTSTATYEFASDDDRNGRQPIGSFLGTWLDGMECFAHSSHSMSNVHVVVDGDRAKSEIYAVVHLVDRHTEPGQVIIRGIHYRDQLLRTPDGWKIDSRRHRLLWLCVVPETVGDDLVQGRIAQPAHRSSRSE